MGHNYAAAASVLALISNIIWMIFICVVFVYTVYKDLKKSKEQGKRDRSSSFVNVKNVPVSVEMI